MLINMLGFLAIFSYGHTSYGATGAILAGNLVMLFQYLKEFNGAFYNFAGNYEEIVQMNAELQTIDSITEEHAKLSKKQDLLKTESWKTIHLQNWNFSYGSPEQHYTLKNIDLELNR